MYTTLLCQTEKAGSTTPQVLTAVVAVFRSWQHSKLAGESQAVLSLSHPRRSPWVKWGNPIWFWYGGNFFPAPTKCFRCKAGKFILLLLMAQKYDFVKEMLPILHNLNLFSLKPSLLYIRISKHLTVLPPHLPCELRVLSMIFRCKLHTHPVHGCARCKHPLCMLHCRSQTPCLLQFLSLAIVKSP